MILTDKIQNKTLRDIAGKISENIPVSREDAQYMLTTNDILDLGVIAHHVRTSLHRDITYYSVNMNMNYTNICELRCPLCAFSCDEEDEKAFLLSLDEIEKRVRTAVSKGISEVHIVGGLHPDLKIDFFEDMLHRIKEIRSDILIVAFSAVEYDYFSRINNIPLEEVFRRLMNAGAGVLPGGGAEIFSPEVRDKISPKKITGEEWLNVMQTAHKMGLKTNATMLYNHIERSEHVVDHLFQIRDLQEETGGFKAFVPLPFHTENTQIDSRRNSTTGYDDIRIYATSRIVLHNIPHLKGLWMYLGPKMAQVLQRFGVDDIGGTYYDEKVVHAAGARTPDHGSESFLRRLIEEAQLTPARVTADYRKG